MLQTRIGRLQGDQRRTHVTRQLQLLACHQQRLLDLGKRPFVAVARQILIQRFQRDLLALRFGEFAFEHANFYLRFTRGLAQLIACRTAGLALRIHIGQPLGELLPQAIDILPVAVGVPAGDGQRQYCKGCGQP